MNTVYTFSKKSTSSFNTLYDFKEKNSQFDQEGFTSYAIRNK